MEVDKLVANASSSIELLEAIASNRGLLAALPIEVGIRLLTAAGKASKPSRFPVACMPARYGTDRAASGFAAG